MKKLRPLGNSRISVANNMNRLTEKDIVVYEGRYLIVKDKKRLIELSNLFKKSKVYYLLAIS